MIHTMKKAFFSSAFGWLILGGALAIAVILLARPRSAYSREAIDGLARCLAAKKVTMYGANWCPHCQNEKRAFGSSFRFVPYVECPEQPGTCLAAGIKGYPTWVFPEGKRIEGEVGLKRLAEESGCVLGK